MIENVRGRITEFRRKIIHEEEETIDEAKASMAKDVDRLDKWFRSMRPELQNKVLERLIDNHDLDDLRGEWSFDWKRKSDISIAEDLLKFGREGLRVDTVVVFFNRWRFPDGHHYLPYGEEVKIACAPFDPNGICEETNVRQEELTLESIDTFARDLDLVAADR